jgi:benzylsuccinate CoA-transferase BbsE subunit
MQPSLAGLRFLDLTDNLGLYGTRLLVDIGAEVIRIEPRSGDPLRQRPPFAHAQDGTQFSLYFAYYNAGKKSVALDVDCDGDDRSRFHDLAATADAILFSGQAHRFRELALADILERGEAPVVAALTPYGLTGPRNHWLGNDLTAWAASGLGYLIGDPDRPPVAPSGELAAVLGSQFLVFATLAALRHRRVTGEGQLVDVSLQEAIVAASGECGLSVYLDDLIPRRRTSNRRRTSAPFGLFRTSDGYGSVLAIMPEHWRAMRRWIHEETDNDAVLDPMFEGGPQSRAGDLWDVVNLFTEDLTRKHTKQELFEQGQQRGIPCAPVNDSQSVVADPQLAEREFWETLLTKDRSLQGPGPAFRLDRSSGRTGHRSVPDLDQHGNELVVPAHHPIPSPDLEGTR